MRREGKAPWTIEGTRRFPDSILCAHVWGDLPVYQALLLSGLCLLASSRAETFDAFGEAAQTLEDLLLQAFLPYGTGSSGRLTSGRQGLLRRLPVASRFCAIPGRFEHAVSAQQNRPAHKSRKYGGLSIRGPGKLWYQKCSDICGIRLRLRQGRRFSPCRVRLRGPSVEAPREKCSCQGGMGIFLCGGNSSRRPAPCPRVWGRAVGTDWFGVWKISREWRWLGRGMARDPGLRAPAARLLSGIALGLRLVAAADGFGHVVLVLAIGSCFLHDQPLHLVEFRKSVMGTQVELPCIGCSFGNNVHADSFIRLSR
jgi:hypothetical protein